MYKRQLSDENEVADAKKWMERARDIALEAKCLRARCGSVIVRDGRVIGSGYNAPAEYVVSSVHNMLSDEEKIKISARCHVSKESYHTKVTDKTCCIHAEQNAILDALQKNPELLAGSRLYFARLSDDGKISYAGKPYCTICSKMTLVSGVKEFVLWHDAGICVYDATEYNDLSYLFSE